MFIFKSLGDLSYNANQFTDTLFQKNFAINENNIDSMDKS